MRTIVAGSRSIIDPAVVAAAMDACGWLPAVIISGAARGVDRLGECWAEEQGIPVERYPADWKRHGRSAGMIRNRQMAQVADALIAIWDGHSRGTAGMVEIMQKAGKRVHMHRV